MFRAIHVSSILCDNCWRPDFCTNNLDILTTEPIPPTFKQFYIIPWSGNCKTYNEFHVYPKMAADFFNESFRPYAQLLPSPKLKLNIFRQRYCSIFPACASAILFHVTIPCHFKHRKLHASLCSRTGPFLGWPPSHGQTPNAKQKFNGLQLHE